MDRVIVEEAYVFAPGDPSVGIPSSSATIDFGGKLTWTPAELEYQRETLRTAFNEVFDDHVEVIFDCERSAYEE